MNGLTAVLLALILAAVFGTVGKMDRQDALRASGDRLWSVAQWESWLMEGEG